MLNRHYISALASQGRARVLHVDMPRAIVAVRFNPPRGGAPGWPRNVVALRCVPYSEACSVRGLIR